MVLPQAAPARWRWIDRARVRPGCVVFHNADTQSEPLLAFGAGAAASHLVGMDAARGAPRVRPAEQHGRVLQFDPQQDLRLDFAEAVVADSARANLIGCVGVSESGMVLCALGGADRWGEVPEYFHLETWRPVELSHPGVLDALWFARWQLTCHGQGGRCLRLLGSELPAAA